MQVIIEGTVDSGVITERSRVSSPKYGIPDDARGACGSCRQTKIGYITTWNIVIKILAEQYLELV